MTQALENLVAGNVKAAMKDAGATSSDLWKVKREHIRIIDGFNVRTHDAEYKAHIRALADSIKANGFYSDKPLAGYVTLEDGVNLISITDGHSRLAGFDLAVSEGAEIDTLPVVVKARGTSAEDLTVALVTSNNGRPLRPHEVAQVIKRLIGFGWDVARIATQLALTKPYVNDLLSLAEAPAAVRKLVDAGKVSATLAISEIKKAPEKAAANLKAAVEKAEAKGKAKATKADTKPAKTAPAKKTKKSVAVTVEPAAQKPLALSDDGRVDLVTTVITANLELDDPEVARTLAEKIVAALFPTDEL